MTVQLPDIGQNYCETLTVCALVEHLPDDLDRWIQSRDDLEEGLIAGYTTISRRKALARAIVTGTPEFLHLHMDFALSSVFVEPPSSTHRRRDIEALLDRFKGREVRVRTEAGFTLPIEEIQEARGPIAALVAYERDSHGIGIKLNRAELEFSRGRVRTVDWTSENERVLINLKMRRRRVVVDDSYLTGSLKEAEVIFPTLCLGKELGDER